MKPIETAPKDRSILLCIEHYWIEGFWDDSIPDWKITTLPSHGCGCCGMSDPAPLGWEELPSTEIEE